MKEPVQNHEASAGRVLLWTAVNLLSIYPSIYPSSLTDTSLLQLELREYSSSSNESHHYHDEEKKEPTFEELRGVHARRHISPNQVIMSIPRRCLITVEMGQVTPIGQAILHADLDLDAPKHIFLMIYILWDRKVHGARSFFAPYYDILPPTLSNMPIFWTPQELKELQGSHLVPQIRDRQQAIADDYHAICQIAPSFADLCTLQEFEWARMCVCSRNFGLQIDGHRTSALVPHADMLNHYRPRETKWTFDEHLQAFTITSLQAIGQGAQVYDSYGQKCNHRFLLNYGFACEVNQELDGFCPNEVPLELSAVLPHATAAVSGQTFEPQRVRICVSNNENTRLLFSLLRALASGDRSSSCRDIRHPLSISNERMALQLLLELVHFHLAQYPTSLAQDVADLANERAFPKFSNLRHAKIQVKGEKEVLHHFGEWAKKGLEVLAILEEEQGSVEVQLNAQGRVVTEEKSRSFEQAIRRLERDESVHHTILRYCADVLGSLRRDEFKSRRSTYI